MLRTATVPKEHIILAPAVGIVIAKWGLLLWDMTITTTVLLLHTGREWCGVIDAECLFLHIEMW